MVFTTDSARTLSYIRRHMTAESGAGEGPATSWFGLFADDIIRYIARPMTLGDAIPARRGRPLWHRRHR